MTDAEFANLPAVSIHAPVFPNRSFNPRTHEGATAAAVEPGVREAVSIHAPMRVRQAPIKDRTWSEMFQSTHP